MAQEMNLMIPDAAELPAYMINPELARQANEDAVFGVSTGYPPRIKMSGKQFVLVDGTGVETPIPGGKLFKGPDDNLYLKTVVVRAKKDLRKRWFATKFDPSKEGVMPDCFSNDGVRPDASIPTPQCDTCANCPNNAFGSGSNENGAATAGKACSDEKLIAVFLPGQGLYELKVTPASLKNWGLYVKALTSRGIPVGNVFTLVGFVPEATFPVLSFQYGGAVLEAGIAKLAALSTSPEAEEIVNQKMTFQAKPQPAAQAAKPAAAKPAAAKPAAPKVVPPKVTPPVVEDDGLGLDDAPAGAATASTGGQVELTDDEIAAELGL